MGCISVRIVPVPVAEMSVHTASENGISSSADCRNAIISAIATAIATKTELSVSSLPIDMTASASSVNTKPRVTIGLVCRVGTSDMYLMVEEGNLITIDGEYMKVLR